MYFLFILIAWVVISLKNNLLNNPCNSILTSNMNRLKETIKSQA